MIREYCLNKAEVTETFPFDEHTLVFKVLGKMFALVGLEKWEKGEKAINLKCNPEYAQELRAEYTSVTPGFHMNKKHWNTVSFIDSSISFKFLCHLIDHSYDCVLGTMPKKMRDKLK